ncbi:hypothetical protein ACFLRC_03945, partial [Candidatus Altiarchaeota archaeon]
NVTEAQFNQMCQELEDCYDTGDPDCMYTVDAVDYWRNTTNGGIVYEKFNDTVPDWENNYVNFQSRCQIATYGNSVYSIPSGDPQLDCGLQGWVPAMPSEVAIITSAQIGEIQVLAHEWGHAMGMACDLYLGREHCEWQAGQYGCITGPRCDDITDCDGGTSVYIGPHCSIMGAGMNDKSSLVYEPQTITQIQQELDGYLA